MGRHGEAWGAGGWRREAPILYAMGEGRVKKMFSRSSSRSSRRTVITSSPQSSVRQAAAGLGVASLSFIFEF